MFLAKLSNKILVFMKRRHESHQNLLAYLRIFFPFKNAYSNCFTNHWILIFIPQILLLFYV